MRDDVEHVRSQLAADHDRLEAATTSLGRLTEEGRLAPTLAAVRRVRNRFVLHVVGVEDTLQSLARADEAVVTALRRDRSRADACMARLSACLEHHDRQGAAEAMRALRQLLEEHATREMGTLR